MPKINHDLRSNDGGTVYHLPEKDGAPGQGNLAPPNVYEESVIALYPVGTKFVDGERVFHYAYSGEALPTTLRGVTGYSAREEDTQPTYDTEQAAGTQDLILDGDGDGDPDTNDWAGMYIVMYVSANYRVTMRIVRNTKAEYAPAFPTVYSTICTLDQPVPCAIPANTTCDIFPSRYADIRAASGTYNGYMYPILGVHLIPITLNRYFWLQTWGPCFISFYATEPGDVAFDRTVAFWHDGSIEPADNFWGKSSPTGNQFAGYTLATNGSGSEWIMLMLDR